MVVCGHGDVCVLGGGRVTRCLCVCVCEGMC